MSDIWVFVCVFRNIVSQIQEKQALCVLVVDMLDPDSSIFPDLLKLIGKRRPLYIVGNKVCVPWQLIISQVSAITLVLQKV